MWGIHDRQLMLRRELYETLTKKSYRQALYRRWRWQQAAQNKQVGTNLLKTRHTLQADQYKSSKKIAAQNKPL